MTEPMTAAEFAGPSWSDSVFARRVLAALEEREALLARVVSGVGGRRRSGMSAVLEAEADSVKEGRKFNVAERVLVIRRAAQVVRELEDELSGWEENAVKHSADAAVGALVRRIREHPESVAPVVHDGYGLDVFTVPVSEDGFRALLSHLDSLLPKEPEVAPSGWRYEPGTHPYVRQIDHEGGTLTIRRADSDAVPPCDREFVAKLLESAKEVGK